MNNEVERLNQMLRDTGYGQGQIDAYVDQCEDIDRLKTALEAVADWRGVFDSNSGLFEKIAERFYQETGWLAPGKDIPAAVIYDRDAQYRAWFEWEARKNHELDRMIQNALGKGGDA